MTDNSCTLNMNDRLIGLLPFTKVWEWGATCGPINTKFWGRYIYLLVYDVSNLDD